MIPRAAVLLVLSLTLAACQKEVVCTAAQATCGGGCASLDSDPANCGACGFTCGSGETCSAGQCCSGAGCSAAVYAACFNGNAVQGATAGLAPVGAPVEVESGPISLAWRAGQLWVATSLSNTLDRMALSPSGLVPSGTLPTVVIPAVPPFSDLEYLAEHDGLLYVSNAAVGQLVVVDPAAASAIAGAVDLGAFSFPQGIAFASGKAYVALNGSGQVAVVDLATRTVTSTIDLSGQASPGASPLPSRMAVVGSRLLVTLWNLDSSFTPAGNGRLAVVDTATDALLPAAPSLDLGAACRNPAGIAANGSTAWVTCGFFPFDATGPSAIQGAAFVPVDLSGATPRVGAAVPVTGAAPGAIAFCDGVGFSGDRFSGNVLRFDPVAGSVTARGLVCSPAAGGSSFVADVACGR
jgi:YVTN family beta-propeller protein